MLFSLFASTRPDVVSFWPPQPAFRPDSGKQDAKTEIPPPGISSVPVAPAASRPDENFGSASTAATLSPKTVCE